MTAHARRLILPGLTTLAMLLVLIALGTWQVERLQWKRGVLAQIAAAEAGAPGPLTDAPEPYTKVEVTGHLRTDLAALYGAEVRETLSGPQMGSELIVPLERDGKPPVLVDRGWVPATRKAPLSQPEGTTTVVGYVRPPSEPGWFSAKDDPPARLFYTLDPVAIGRALGLPTVSPYTVVAMGPEPPEHWPDPAKHLPRPPNNHLSYAITWYGLAIALVVIFALWARKTVHQ